MNGGGFRAGGVGVGNGFQRAAIGPGFNRGAALYGGNAGLNPPLKGAI